jgi:alginate O-acetyltransferase complex protein AlgI
MTGVTSGWAGMWCVAIVMFTLFKVTTCCGVRHGSWRRWVAYLLAWPGLNAPQFLSDAMGPMPVDRGELRSALISLLSGMAVLLVAGHCGGTLPPWTVGAMGFMGVVLTLHFGCFALASISWRSCGVQAAPMMDAPWRATRLGEFWGRRWNSAFADWAKHCVFAHVQKRWGVWPATVAVFLVSGVVHEAVITWPARGAYGGPMTYFLVQTLGLAAQKATWVRRRLSNTGQAWLTRAVVILPLPLLFPRLFLEDVVAPFILALTGQEV